MGTDKTPKKDSKSNSDMELPFGRWSQSTDTTLAVHPGWKYGRKKVRKNSEKGSKSSRENDLSSTMGVVNHRQTKRDFHRSPESNASASTQEKFGIGTHLPKYK